MGNEKLIGDTITEKTLAVYKIAKQKIILKRGEVIIQCTFRDTAYK